MCNCVPGEVLRQCSAANPADIYTVHDCTRLKKYPSIYFMPIDTAVCMAYVYIILTPHEYYMVLPALAINALLSQCLPHQLCTLHLLSNSIIGVSLSEPRLDELAGAFL